MDSYGVIFDMDGVLVDSRRPHWLAFRRLGEEIGHPFPPALFDEIFGQANPTIVARWLGDDLSADRVAELGDRKESVYRAIAAECLETLPDIPALLDALAVDGARLAVGSSGPVENVAMMLDRFGWRDRFTAAVSKNDVAEGKPDPAIFLAAARGIDLPPDRCVVIEDAPAGIEAARRAGMACVAITSSRPRDALAAADRIVDAIGEIAPPVLRALAGGKG